MEKKQRLVEYNVTSLPCLLCFVSIVLVDWIEVPLGLAPSQNMTGTTLELPPQLDNESIPAHSNGVFSISVTIVWF